MIGQLINTVSKIMEEQVSMREEQTSMKNENETRHEEVMKKLHEYKADNDLLWNKTTKNEREIGIVKKLYDF